MWDKIKKPFKSIRKLSRRNLIIAVIIIAVLAFFLWPKNSSKDQIEYQTVTHKSIQSKVSASGVLAGKDTADLKFKGGGKLTAVNIKVGDKITKGETLASIDTQELSISLETAQNNLRTAQAELEKTLDDIHLFQYGNGGFSNVGTPSETETQKQSRVAAEMNVNNAKDSVSSAQRDFQDAVMTSPIDGIATQVPFYTGQVVSPADVIAEVVNESQIYFDTDVDESDISKVAVGQNVQVTLNAYPDQTFNGTVAEILPVTKTTSSGATVVTTRVNLQNPKVNFVSGLNGQVDIVYASKDNIISIPFDALRDDNTVLVKKADGIHSVPVKTGLQSDTDVEITSGLSDGDQIVTNPTVVTTKQIKTN